MVADVANVDHGGLAQLALKTHVPRLHVAHLQVGIELADAVAWVHRQRIDRPCRLGARRQRGIAEPNRTRSPELHRESVWRGGQAESAALVYAPDGDEVVHALAHGCDGIAGPEDRVAIPADQHRKRAIAGS